jgi:hypothetical protein
MTHRTLIMLGAVLAAGVTGATTTDFTRYQSIIDRSPFGQVQSNVPDAAPNWLANYVFCGLIQSNSGNGAVQAIISTKDNNRWVFRAEGEIVDSDVVVQKIDQSQRSTKVVLKKGLETGTLAFPERTAVPMAAAPNPAMPPGVGAPPPAAGGAVPPTIRRIPFRRGN